MTIQITEPEVPRALPTARLYLDDIEQIAAVFSHLALRYATQDTTGGIVGRSEPLFRVGNREATEIDDLRKITKTTTDFALKLEQPRLQLHLQLDSRGLHWWSGGLSRAEAWQTFHKLEAIVQPRAPFLAGARPLLLLAAALASLSLFPNLTYDAGKSPTPARIAAAVTTMAVLVVSAWFLILDRARPRTTVTLRYSYEESARKEERRSQILIATVSATLGFIAGVALDAVARKLLHW